MVLPNSKTMTTALTQLFTRDLNRLIAELEKYAIESQIWLGSEGINNSAGTLALHLVGNLNYYIGATLGNTGYVRNREAEFNIRDTPRIALVNSVNQTIDMIEQVLPNLSKDLLEAEYPIHVFGKPIDTIKFLIHLQGHLNYHLGQVNYHRRLLTHS